MRSSLESDVTPCVVTGQQQQQPRKKRFPGRWSLRHLLYSSPLLNRRRSGPSSSASGSSKQTHRAYTSVRESSDGAKLGSSSKTDAAGTDRATALHHVEIHQATSRTSVYTTSTKSGENATSLECHLCLADVPIDEFWDIAACGHRACIHCLQQYLRVEITESRVCISCPECSEPIHPNEIRSIADDSVLYEKYEDFMVRRVLAVDPDTRWCPAPDCGFAVIASECASCPKLKCERPGCDSYFCYHCKAEWHPNQTCDAARAQRSPNILLRSSSITYSQDSQHRDDIKPCPRCQVLIVKMDDGSCNHMMCAVCGAEFCWLCMKEISDLHYLSPSGCTFWGKKPWSRKKKILWQLGTLVGAPVGIALVAGITVPAMIIGIPVWVGRKLYTRYKMANKHKRNAAIVGGVIASVIISPVLAGLAVGIGVPILLFYVYGVVPVSLCRSGGCGGSASNDDSTIVNNTNRTSQASGGASGAGDNASMADAASAKVPNPSIGEASLSMASGSQVLVRDVDRESASTVALAGSLASSGCATLASGSIGCGRLEIQAELASNSSSTVTAAQNVGGGGGGGNQRYSITSLSESGANVSISGASGGGQDNDGAASTRALAGSILNYKTGGNDSCTEDGTSERVRFDDNVSFIVSTSGGGGGASSQHYEKASIGSSCSFRARCISGSSTTPSTTTTKSLNFSTNNYNPTASTTTSSENSNNTNNFSSSTGTNKGGLLLSVADPVAGGWDPVSHQHHHHHYPALGNDSISIDMLGGVATAGGDQPTLSSHPSASYSLSPHASTVPSHQITRSSAEDGGDVASNDFNVNTSNVRTAQQLEQQTASGVSRKSQAAILRNQFFYSGSAATTTSSNPTSNDVPPPPPAPPMPFNDSVVAMTINKAVIEVANEISPNRQQSYPV